MLNLDLSNHVMIDLETLGTRAGGGILAVGACTLDGTKIFYKKVLPSSNICYNLFTDASTIEWHEKQSEEVYRENFSGTTDLKAVLQEFSAWLSEIPNLVVWANGANFDLPILEEAFHCCEIKTPWKYNATRCHRTLKELFLKYVPYPPEAKDKHTALSDAISQAAHATTILDWLHSHANI